MKAFTELTISSNAFCTRTIALETEIMGHKCLSILKIREIMFFRLRL